MGATIGKVSAVFTASASGLTAGTRDAGASLRRLSTDVASLRGNMRLLTAISVAGFVTSIAGAASRAAGSFVTMGQAQSEVIDKTSKMSSRLGMTYGELAGIAHAGDLAGVSMETIAKAATKSDVAFVKAAQGSKLAKEAFDGIGLSVTELQGLSAADRFTKITDAIAAMPTEAERAAASIKLFGKAGAELLPLFSGGSGAIKEATDKAKAFGLALTSAQGRDVEAMNDAWTDVKASISGVVTQVTASLAPAMKGIFDSFTGFIGSVGGATIGQRIGDGLIQGARVLAGIGDSLIVGLGGIGKYLAWVGSNWAAVFDFGRRFASLLAGVGRVFVGSFQTFLVGLARIAGVFSKTARELTKDLAKPARQSFKLAGQNFDAAFGDGGRSSSKTGPLVAAIDAAIAQRFGSANSIDKAATQTIAGGGPVAARLQEVKAIDSRSKEGVAEMFRLMRGERDTVQERIADATERVADNTEDIGIDVEEINFAW